jgi:hypothetical protein
VWPGKWLDEVGFPREVRKYRTLDLPSTWMLKLPRMMIKVGNGERLSDRTRTSLLVNDGKFQVSR